MPDFNELADRLNVQATGHVFSDLADRDDLHQAVAILRKLAHEEELARKLIADLPPAPRQMDTSEMGVLAVKAVFMLNRIFGEQP